jgi:hypothetical protein
MIVDLLSQNRPYVIFHSHTPLIAKSWHKQVVFTIVLRLLGYLFYPKTSCTKQTLKEPPWTSSAYSVNVSKHLVHQCVSYCVARWSQSARFFNRH